MRRLVCGIVAATVLSCSAAFAAGADIREMVEAGPVEMLQRNTIGLWDRIQTLSKPIIAAVSGYTVGGGCELALLCDMIVASETARFAQPEINIGVIPGAGGTQRLARTLGKHRAMEFILTGRTMLAQEALAVGLACRVVPPGEYIVNVHAYRLEPNEAPMRVTIYVRAMLVSENNFYEVAQQSVDLNHEGEQVTVLRFSLNEHGALVPGSINNLQADLRTSGN